LSCGQFESYPCNCCNTKLKDLFNGSVLEKIYVHDCKGAGLHELSSSFLMPEGTPPKIIESPEGGPPDDAAYVNWTCKYSMGNISDEDPKTAWVEGVEGPGIGEVLIVPCLDLKKSARIWIGYGKSDAIFIANNRPKKVRTVIVRAELQGAVQVGFNYENLTIIADRIVSLEDKNGYQNLPIPEFTIESYYSKHFESNSEYKYFLGVEILDVFLGSKYNDTCISEISNE
jgi:hypothetical protein